MIDQPTIDRILDAANIVDVVSEFVTLRKRGINYVGLCPFHSDKSPSFYVSPAKNICKCFACGEGGTAVHFIMKHEQLSYYDALRFLAKKYNIEIQERELSEREKQVRSDRESMLIVNSWAQKYFTTQLYEHQEGKAAGLRYFAERGFREDTIRKFQLGYSLDQRDALYKAATKSGYKKEFLEKTGLVIAYDNGGVNDRFRGRVIFPVHTLSGKVVAFGGRVLKKDEKTAKYVNSPESEIYHKSNELYGIYFAKQAIVKEDRCFLVEGYTDVISMHQAGVENVVASSGTALTQGQIRLIHRFTSNITVLYDGDAAGIKAALRGIDLLLEDGMNVKVVLLPDGEDPDSFARKHNASQFAEFIRQNETDFIRFKTRLLLDDAGTDPIKRSALISDIIRTVAIIPDNIARSLYIRECSTMMEIDEMLLLNEVNKIRLNKEERQANTPSSPIPATPINIPEYPDIPGYQPYPEETLAEQPQEIKTTAALEDSDDLGELQDNPPPVPAEPEVSAAVSIHGILEAFLALADLGLIALAALEIRRQLRMRSWRQRWKTESARDKVLQALMIRLMKALAVDYQPGWKAEATAQAVNQKLPGIAPADMLRVQALIEKQIYAELPLQPYEQRVLIDEIEQIFANRKSLKWKERLRLRYCL